MFWPSIQISPASGCINPMRCFRSTLLPPPLRPMMTNVSPFDTVRSIPHKISWRPIFFVNPRTSIMGEVVAAAVTGGRGLGAASGETILLST
jgi:hypothetical protein